ncbi:MAG TPA: response regulator [Leeuwenhoekiella sp.]|nr:response regulator [Leeuwenhoekiella sp.]
MKKNYLPRHYWLSIITFVIFSCISILLYTYFSKGIPNQLTDRLEVAGKVATHNFELSISKNLLYLENLALQLEEDDVYSNQWDSYSQRLIDRNANARFIAFIDETGELKGINPSDYWDSIDEQLRSTFKKYFNTAEISQNPQANWLKHYGKAHILLVNYPIRGKNIKGSLVAAIDMDAELGAINNFLSDYAFLLKNEEGNVVYSYNSPNVNAFEKTLIFNSSLTLDNSSMQEWSMQLCYHNNDIYDHSFMVVDWMLVFGILLSLLMGSLLFFYLKSLDAVKHAKLGNMQLLQTNMELEGQRKKAQKASRAKTEFLSNMSHEIRTPLNAILGICELLNTSRSKTEKENYIHMMQESSKNLLVLVNDILAINRIESGNENLALDRFEPCAILENLITFQGPKIKSKNLKLETCLNSCTKNAVMGDRTKFEQISLNLVSNAIKFTQNGSIYISCEERVIAGSRVAICLIVKDTGIGIPTEKQEAIFERFTQLDVGVRKKHSGGGLGLYITRKHVQLMQGCITVNSKEGEGSEFRVNLELPLAENTKRTIDQAFVKELKEMRLSVLAVDDNKLNVIILVKLLRNMGMNPDFAYNGKEALEKTESKNYDIIFMDVHMPEMDGYETTRRIRHTDDNVLILGLSADATTSSIDEGLCAGMNDYLTKPLDLEKLAILLKERFMVKIS